MLLKDKLGFFLPDRIYAEALPSSGKEHGYQHNTKTYSSSYDLVPTPIDVCNDCPELGYSTNTQFYSQNPYVPSTNIQGPYRRLQRSFSPPEHPSEDSQNNPSYGDMMSVESMNLNNPDPSVQKMSGHPMTYQNLIASSPKKYHSKASTHFWEKLRRLRKQPIPIEEYPQKIRRIESNDWVPKWIEKN